MLQLLVGGLELVDLALGYPLIGGFGQNIVEVGLCRRQLLPDHDDVLAGLNRGVLHNLGGLDMNLYLGSQPNSFLPRRDLEGDLGLPMQVRQQLLYLEQQVYGLIKADCLDLQLGGHLQTRDGLLVLSHLGLRREPVT